MKSLTLRHPWAFCICHWGKRVENRTWKPPASLIGQRIAIHGGKCPTASGLEEVRWHFGKLVKKFGLPEYRVNGDLTLKDVILEGIVATAVIDSVICKGSEPMADDPWFDGFYGSNIGWVLRDVIVLPEPIPCKGAQGLWNVPDSVVDAIRKTRVDAVGRDVTGLPGLWDESDVRQSRAC